MTKYQGTGKLRIGLVSGTDGSYVSVELHDGASGVRFAEARVSVEAIGQTLMSHCEVDCELELRGLDKIGREREWRTERLEVPLGTDYRADKLAAVAAADARLSELGEGWSYRESDLTNIHTRSFGPGGERIISVHFERWKPRA